MTADREAWWLAAIQRQPSLYTLSAYYHVMPAARAAGYFARWERDEAEATEPAPLCRRCGVLIKFPDRLGQQLHWWCTPPGYLTQEGAA